MIKKLLILSVILIILLTGCNKKNEEDFYEIDEYENELTISNTSINKEYSQTNLETQKIINKEIEKILNNSKHTIEESQNYNGTDMSDLLLLNFSENKYETFDTIISENKPTIMLMISSSCSSCSEINYTNILALGDSANVILASQESIKDKDTFIEKGIYQNIYLIDLKMLVDNFCEDEKLEEIYRDITTTAFPSCIFINKNRQYEFTASGTKYASEIENYLNGLKILEEKRESAG